MPCGNRNCPSSVPLEPNSRRNSPSDVNFCILLFPLELMPTWLATLASLNPATYAILMIREMMSGVTQDISLIMGLGILLIFAGVMVAIASYVFRKEVNKPF